MYTLLELGDSPLTPIHVSSAEQWSHSPSRPFVQAGMIQVEPTLMPPQDFTAEASGVPPLPKASSGHQSPPAFARGRQQKFPTLCSPRQRHTEVRARCEVRGLGSPLNSPVGELCGGCHMQLSRGAHWDLCSARMESSTSPTGSWWHHLPSKYLHSTPPHQLCF